MRVEVYRNLHAECFSVREAHGKVVAHVFKAFMGPSDFVVQPAGRAKVLESGTKNVHAFVRGPRITVEQGDLMLQRVMYNPYVMDSFWVYRDGKRIPVTRADYVALSYPAVWAAGVR